jgi:hypothetical protein
VEQQLFAGAGAEVFWPAPSPGIKFFKNVTKNLNFYTKITILLLFTLKNLMLIIDVFKNHENLLKP